MKYLKTHYNTILLSKLVTVRFGILEQFIKIYYFNEAKRTALVKYDKWGTECRINSALYVFFLIYYGKFLKIKIPASIMPKVDIIVQITKHLNFVCLFTELNEKRE